MSRTTISKAILLGAAALALAAAAPADDGKPEPSRTAKAAPGVARRFTTAYRTDTVELPLGASGGAGQEAEYSVRLKAGALLVYSWSVKGVAAGQFYAEFHGATLKPPLRELDYREGNEIAAEGSLTAPFAGEHGWLFKNDSDKPVTVKLTLAGFYELPSLRESMGLEGPAYIPFGPPGWPDRFGPAKKAVGKKK